MAMFFAPVSSSIGEFHVTKTQVWAAPSIARTEFIPSNVSKRTRGGGGVVRYRHFSYTYYASRPLRVARSTLSTRVLLNLRRAAAVTWRGGISDSMSTSLVFGMASSRFEHEEVP